MAVNPITHNTGGIFRFSDYIAQIPDFLKAEQDAVVLLQVLSDYINNAYRNVTIIKKFKFKLIALENNVISTTNTLQKLADLFSFAESRSTNVLFLSKVQDPTDPTNPEKNGFSQDPFNDPPTPNTFYSTVGGKTPRLLEFTPSDISKVRARKVKQVGNIVFYEVFFTATLDNIKDSKSAFEIDADDDGDLTQNFLVNYYNHPIINPKSLEKLPYGFSVEFNGVRQNKADVTSSLAVLSSGSDYVQFTASASSLNAFYNNVNIRIDSGTGAGQVRKIVSYNGLSKIAVVDSDWVTNPDNTSVISALNIIKLDSGASTDENFYVGHTIKIISGTGIGQIRQIVEYRGGSNKIAVVDSNWSVQPNATSIFITIAPKSPNLEWATKSIFSKSDPCSGGLDISFWEPDATIIDSGSLVPVIPAVAPGKYASNAAIAYANTIQSYNDITEYSADLSIYVSSGVSTEFKMNSAISIGEAQGTPRLMVGLSTFTNGSDDGIYFVISENGSSSFIYKEKLTNGVALNTLFEGRAKIILTSSSIDIYWDDNLRFSINERIIQSKYGFIAIYQNLFGSQSHGFIDNISLVGNDADLPEENEIPSQGFGFFYARDLTNLDKRSEFVNFSTGLNKFLDPIFYKATPSQPLQYDMIVDDLTRPLLRVPYKSSTGPFMVGDRISRWDGFDPESIARDNFATILEVHAETASSGYLVIDTLNGDWVSQGSFAKIVNNTIGGVTAEVDSNAFPWYPFSFYFKDSEITYKNTKYKVLKSHETSPNETPENNLGLYFKNMVDNLGNNLIIYKKKLDTNPYMFGLYRVKHIDINQDPDFEGLGFSGLCNDLYIQPAEELDIKFKTKQRDWLFNPRLASKTQLKRNGWLEVTRFSGLNTDIVNSTIDIQDGSILFCRQNLFDITANNPEIATTSLNTEGWYKYRINKVDWQKTTSYDSSIFPITTDPSNGEEYNIYVNVPNLNDQQKLDVFTSAFTVDLFTNEIVLSTPVPATFLVGSKVFLKSTGALPSGFKNFAPFYVVSIDGTFTRLQLSDTFNGAAITLINAGTGIHTITKSFNLKNGNVITLNSQTDTRENGKWKIVNNGGWIRLNKRTVMKITDITVDFEVVDNLALSDDPIKYVVHDDVEVENFIPPTAVKVYKIEKGYANNFRFTLESVDGIDTTVPFQLQYDARFDSNSIADVSSMSKAFRGVPDMGYPLVEKIERLVYQKDPSVIDLELIGYLARFMGYDISQVSDDVSESNLYTSDKEREAAIRRMIQNLPQYYALRATETGLESILLAFGIVGEVIRLWTVQDNPYDQFISENDITNFQYTNRERGVTINLIPTPHFFLRINVNSNLDNDINSREIGRIKENVIRYKPINTVFDGIVLYLSVKLRQRISLSPLLGTLLFAIDVGYDIDFSEQIDNGC